MKGHSYLIIPFLKYQKQYNEWNDFLFILEVNFYLIIMLKNMSLFLNTNIWKKNTPSKTLKGVLK